MKIQWSPRRDRRCGEIITEEDDASVEIPFPELRDGELFVADLADAARDRLRKVIEWSVTPLPCEHGGRDASSARDDADQRASSLEHFGWRWARRTCNDDHRRVKRTRPGAVVVRCVPACLGGAPQALGETGGGRRVKRTARGRLSLDDLDLGAFQDRTCRTRRRVCTK